MSKWVFFLFLCILPLHADLEEYVNKPESVFAWEQVSKTENVYKLSLVSQMWKETRWYHRIYAVVPEKVEKNSPALLWISGSGNGETEIKYAQKVVEKSGAPVFVLMDVPNQPLFEGLLEDALISYTFAKFFEEKDREWALLLPMVKSAVQAMNVASLFYKKTFNSEITGFAVTGASKRGWTTWLTSAIDKRVKVIIPIVFDNLNFDAQMENQIAMWGKYSEQIQDYTEKGLQEKLDLPEGQILTNIVDPYSYRDKITIPKFMIVGTNDRYWPLNAMDMYYKSLQGSSYIVYIPNNGHRIKSTSRIEATFVASLAFIKNQKPLPEFWWGFEEQKPNIKISFKTSKNLKEIKIWRADAEATDFRESHWIFFDVPSFVKSVTVPLPERGNRAVYAEAVFDYEGEELSITSEVYITK